MKDSLERKRLFWTAVVAVIVLINAVISYRAVLQLVEHDRWISHSREVTNELTTTLSLMKDAETGTRGFVITGDEEHLKDYDRATAELGPHLQRIQELTIDNKLQQGRMPRLRELIADKLDLLKQGQLARRNEGFEGIQKQIPNGRGKSVMDAIREQIGMMLQDEDILLATRQAESLASHRNIIFTFTFATILILALLALISQLLKRGLAERQSAEDLLREQKERLAVTLTSIGDAVIATDAEGAVTFANPIAEQLLGWQQDQIMGKPLSQVFNLVNEETRAKVESPVERVIREGVVVGLANHTILITTGGREVPIEDSGAPIKDKSGRVVGVILVFHDVTERRQAEAEREQLLILEQRARGEAETAKKRVIDILESLNDGFYTLDRQWRFTYLNERCAELARRPREALIGKNIWEVFPDGVERPGYGILQRAMTEGVAAHFEDNYEPLDLWMENDIYPSPEGLSVFVRDISGRKRAEATQSLLAAIVESSDDAIIGKDLAGIITAWNFAAEQLFGYSAEEVIGRSITILIPDDRLHEESLILERLKRGEKITHYESVRRCKDGRLADVSLSISPIKDSSGQPVGASKIARDITLAKRLEREREELLIRERAARADAESANRLKDEFLATISHELRTPLTSILGWSALLKTGAIQGPTIDKALEVIERNANAQLRIVDDILDVSRIITGKLQMEARPIELAPLIRAAVSTVRPATEAKEIKLEMLLGSDADSLVSGDPNRLQQVIWNLLSNAVKFTPRGGRIEVRLESIGSLIEISVSDTGAGISPEFLPFVFERFRQADSSITRSHAGLGLGLAIVRHLVELHGGTVSAESRGENQGACFKVRLPLTAAPEKAAPFGNYGRPMVKETAYSHQSGGDISALMGLRLLVVDDEPDTREVLTRILTSYGADVHSVTSAAEALESVVSWRPNVLISDLGMPGEDGIALIRKVRLLPPGSGGTIPALALTAYAREEDQARSLSAGYQTYLPKPVEPARLAVVVARLVQRKTEE